MLRSTRKEVCEKLHKTLIDSAWDEMQEIAGVGLDTVPEDERWELTAKEIWRCFHETYYFGNMARLNRQEMFREWCSGLPNYMPSFYYNWDCKKYIQELLEESDEEAERYSEREAETLLANLFYREITKAADR